MYKESILKDEFKRSIRYDESYLMPLIDDLNNFVLSNSFMNNLLFAKDKLMSFEIKNNNNIEGYKDDISTIEKALKKDEYKHIKRIQNLYNGYKYILLNKEINKENLKELYSILSDGLLEESYKNNMNDYRMGPVYILKGNNLSLEPYEGMNFNDLNYFMDMFFSYVNNPSCEENTFIKSQIMHYYFVYVHPYFDVNGRTSRTVSMWYLLNKHEYPYIIFNDAISLAKNKYEKSIVLSRSKSDITLFLEYMLKCVKKELEKEYIINSINENIGISLSNDEHQIINYLLSMNGNLTVKDITNFYNNYNDKKRYSFIDEMYIKPLLEKEVLINNGFTKNNNYNILLNKRYIDVDDSLIKYIKKDKYM